MPPGTYRVEFNGLPFQFNKEYWNDKETIGLGQDVVVGDGATVPDINALLNSGGYIAGTVTNAGNAPMSNVTVQAYEQVSGSPSVLRKTGFTDANGAYRLNELGTASYRVKFTDNSGTCPVEWWDNAANEGSATNVDVVGGLTTGGISPQLCVGAANAAPVLSPETPSLTTSQGVAGTVGLTASDADSDPLTWSISGQGTKGTASVPAGTGTSKTVTYTPNAGVTGADSFTVQVSDGHGGTDQVTVSVTITPATSLPPTPAPITGFVAGASGGIRVGEVRVAQTSLDGDPSLTLGYQWQHAGKGGTWVNIPGAAAQGRSFELPPSVMKINVRVVVTAQRAGVAPAVSASGPLLILPGNHNASKLRIVGPHRVGKRLVAKVKVPDKAEDLEIRYVWTVAGTQLRLTGRSIIVPAAAAGRKVFVDIRLVAPGYHNQELRSPMVNIA